MIPLTYLTSNTASSSITVLATGGRSCGDNDALANVHVRAIEQGISILVPLPIVSGQVHSYQELRDLDVIFDYDGAETAETDRPSPEGP